jgi:prepilin-type N-terminal cleavage/methylation domain-containing protein
MEKQGRAGFTLLELLAVIVIVGILAAVLVSQLSGGLTISKTQTTKQFLQKLDLILGEYNLKYGRYPPSSFTPEQGVPNDGENVGIEALVVALYSNKWEAGNHEIDPKYFGNIDNDQSARSLTDFGNRNLLELVDEWQNPIAYIYRTDYGLENRVYVTVGEDGQEVRGTPVALKDPLKGQYFKHDSFQLISAGPDCLFNTGDDLYNFEFERE